VKLIDGTGAFTIDNAVAKALRDDYHRLGALERKKYGDPLSAAEVEEESKIRARIADRARAIGCPAGYELKEAQRDSNRLHQLYCKRISPPSCGGGALPDAEDAEEAARPKPASTVVTKLKRASQINVVTRPIGPIFMPASSSRYSTDRSSATPDRIEALDMGRRGLHDEGSHILMERLKRKVTVDFDLLSVRGVHARQRLTSR
jgi:hypothetical protein